MSSTGAGERDLAFRAGDGEVKTSSVGMLGQYLFPLDVDSAPPSQTGVSVSPISRSVPGPL